jgi:hypothetical protein
MYAVPARVICRKQDYVFSDWTALNSGLDSENCQAAVSRFFYKMRFSSIAYVRVFDRW